MGSKRSTGRLQKEQQGCGRVVRQRYWAGQESSIGTDAGIERETQGPDSASLGGADSYSEHMEANAEGVPGGGSFLLT